jgi:predicted regulator of Ras-like GTPase activity (Roadblock/LC7/MglB family)
MTTQYREDTLTQTLENLTHNMSGIRAAVIVNVDGLVVAAYPPVSDDFNDPQGGHSVAATTALITGLAERTLQRLAQGNLDRVMIEGEHGAIGVYPCTEDATLAVLIDKQAKLGLALTLARKTATKIRSILDKK